ncbi:hypothetical protein EDB86DRAFT_2938956, partial [Lactarius hatsudake]
MAWGGWQVPPFPGRAHSGFDQDVHSPDTVTPGPLSCIDSLPPKRRATERIDSTREGPERPPANKRLRTTTTSESLRPAMPVRTHRKAPTYRACSHSSPFFAQLPPRARTSGMSGRRPHRLPNLLPPTRQHAFPPPEGAGLARSQAPLHDLHQRSHRFAHDRPRRRVLFTKLRARHQWASFRTTPPKWVEAPNHFSAELELVNCSNNRRSAARHSRTRAPLWPCWGPSKRRWPIRSRRATTSV